MTGIERLRAIAGARDEWVLGGALADIAEQIERERDAEVADSPYDAILPEDRDAITWVREHGGLDEVRRRWKYLSYYADPVPRSCMEKRLARLQRQIDESHAALRRRNQRIAFLASEINREHNENRMEFLRRAGNFTAFADEVCKRLAPQLRHVEGCTKDVMDAALEALDRRLMPEGCEWPRYEDGEPVRIGDVVSDVEVRSVVFRDGGILLSDCTSVPGWGTWRSYKEPIKRPAVPAADGEPLEVGQTVYAPHYGYAKCTVLAIEWVVDGYLVEVENEGGHKFRQIPDEFTHQRLVLDADGVPIREGDTVFCRVCGGPLPVTKIDSDGTVWTGGNHAHAGDDLIHEQDTWERIEEDVMADAKDYCESRGISPEYPKHSGKAKCEDLVRRCRALAERGE